MRVERDRQFPCHERLSTEVTEILQGVFEQKSTSSKTNMDW